MVSKGDDVVLARTEIDYRRSARMGQVARTVPRVVTPNGRGARPQSSSMRPKRVPPYLREMIGNQEE